MSIQKKIVIITCYIGKLPDYFPVWLRSCEFNPTIDFVVISDQKWNNYSPNNVRILQYTLEQLREKIQKHFNFEISLKKPYKICDYKPVYGLIFADLINKYDFWGHCDLDVVWGDIRSYITNAILENNRKIFYLGHLSLYSNDNITNNTFKLKGANFNYKTVYSKDENFGFDEYAGMKKIFEKNSLPLYKQHFCADIKKNQTRFIISEKYGRRNFTFQVFYWEEGHIFRSFIDKDVVKTDEFIYIHFSSRMLSIIDNIYEQKSFYILPDGFKKKKIGKPDKNDIISLSDYKGLDFEKKENKDYKKKNLKLFIKSSLLRKIIWIRIRYKI